MTGVITLSLEIELGWGYHDLGRFDRLSRGRRWETKTLHRLLNLCDELDLPITFDVVGHLLHEPPVSYDTPHTDDWFDSIPNNRDPLFYAPDLVEAIQEADTEHEICTHTYSHALCGNIPTHVLEWELRRANEVQQEIGETSVSLVPPRHSQPAKEVLRDSNIEIVRVIGNDPAPTKLHKLNRLVFEPQEPIEPRMIDGVVETYCSGYSTLTAATLASGVKPPLSMFRAIPTAVRQRLHERYLIRAMEKAIEQDSYIHLWSHLHDMANDDQWPPIRTFLRSLAEQRDLGTLTVMPMEELNEHVRVTSTESTGTRPEDREITKMGQ
ncbi:polysaccharide deacetylase family protein [Haladaptatus sp. DFWS20]|uniref:polysaccharide deacetylase family protein n=1 Tax=Haladaptatus sp. DFWS20 TaxID=3403467 RepID=UPI003EC002FB